ncbi:MAG TPA: hybrid sensor histidine kinase/response regulator [Bacteroidales bacterium]|nr:MAG: Alkaline phosphatase synthesis sensor protein PhoR [Bacteroidetes bacterium ADurb.Bin041]HPW42751.1 hybrid sensor histidine kinase/response regulator [Bacteroidales bacterium]
MATLKILVVDDEPGIRSGVERILRNFKVDYPFMDDFYDFLIINAETGEEAIALINSEMPDIALLDNKLPGIQGVEVLEYIRKHNYDITVAMITSHASLDLALKVTRDGAFDFIPKPFTPQELKSSLENITKQIFLKRMARGMKHEGKQVRFQFLSVLSHELKAPLTAVEGYLTMIKERQLGNTLEDYDEAIERSLKRLQGMRNLILNLLDLTKIESGKPSQKIQNTNLVEIIKTSIDTMMPFAIQKDVKITLQAPEKVVKYLDPEEMEIIFNNLISNAIKYNKTGGTIEINLTEESGKTIIKVKDSGIGINEENLRELFKDFMRIKSDQTRNISGSGLGLSIVKKIVDLNNGEISVESKLNEGSTFKVVLPV